VALKKTGEEIIWAQLIRENKTYTVALALTVGYAEVEESDAPARSYVTDERLSKMSGRFVPDGVYTLRYTYGGKQTQKAVRVRYGALMSRPS
jgi:hypothetical protein